MAHDEYGTIVMPLWDFHCPTCKTTIERWFRSYTDSQNAVCETCQTTLVRCPSVGTFVVNGYNARNNYSRNS